MLSFQCQFIVNKFLGSGLFLLFLWMIVLEKKRGVEKKDEMAVHSQRHAKSDLYDWACIALLLLIVFSQKGIIHPQIGWGYLCFGLLQGLEALLFYYYEKKEDPLD